MKKFMRYKFFSKNHGSSRGIYKSLNCGPKSFDVIKNVNLNRSNIEGIIKKKIANIPILENDTNSVIEFNSTFFNETQDKKKRNFWDLLKIE